jgi:hypothetical protein
MEIPSSVWQGLVALFASATLYLGILARKEEKPKELALSLRTFIDNRAEHKVNNVVGALVPKLLTPLQNDVSRHGDQLDRLMDSERDHGERMVKVETTLTEVVGRLEREREETVNTMRRIESKVDTLLTGEKYRS